jgi:hypothetical protein
VKLSSSNRNLYRADLVKVTARTRLSPFLDSCQASAFQVGRCLSNSHSGMFPVRASQSKASPKNYALL